MSAIAPKEIERKFLIERPDERDLWSLSVFSVTDITQTYLRSDDPDIERRVRQCVSSERGYEFFYTEKSDTGSFGERFEKEEQIRLNEYIGYLSEADMSLKQIQKTRYCFYHAGKLFELDDYHLSSRYAILEVELDDIDEPLVLPYVNVVKEVTGDPLYSNRGLAERLIL